VNVITPGAAPGLQRPGALPQESRLPVGMVYANFAAGKEWGIEGFAQYEYRPNVMAGCGTFFQVPNYAPVGCNYVSVLGGAPFLLNDPASLTSGRYAHRGPDVDARDSGQYGASLRYLASNIDTDLRVYAMTYHSRAPSIRVTNPNIGGGFGALATTRLTDPNGLKYSMLYAEDIELYGVSFDSALDKTTRVYGEFAYRPNQTLNLNASDLIAAFLTRSPTSALNLAKGTNAIAPGGTFDGYDRRLCDSQCVGLPAAAGRELPGHPARCDPHAFAGVRPRRRRLFLRRHVPEGEEDRPPGSPGRMGQAVLGRTGVHELLRRQVQQPGRPRQRCADLRRRVLRSLRVSGDRNATARGIPVRGTCGRESLRANCVRVRGREAWCAEV